MIQAYSDGVTVAANGTYPLNNVVFLKGNTAVVAGASGIALTKRGIYNVHVDGFADKIRKMNDKNVQFRRRGDGNYANYNFYDDDEDEEEDNYTYDYMRNYRRYYR